MIEIRDIIYTSNILEASKQDSLSKALSKLPSSHSAAFIFDRDKKLLGIVNPYHCVIKSSLPGNAKVDACIFHPQKLYLTSPMEKVIQNFISSKIHYLPIFGTNDEFVGIISARKVLDGYKGSRFFQVPISYVLNKKNRPLITVEEDEPISHAIHLFKAFKVSKLVVVNKAGKLKGVLSYFDIIHFLITPKERLGGGNKDHILTQSVKKFAKSFVLTLTSGNLVSEALNLILDKKIGSVVIIDSARHPIGIITTRDFFDLMLQPSARIHFQTFNKNLSRSSKRVVRSFVKPLMHFLETRKNISEARLSVKEEKNSKLFKVIFALFTRKGKQEVISREGNDLQIVLQEVKRGVRNSEGKQKLS